MLPLALLLLVAPPLDELNPTAWVPMGATAPASLVQEGGAPALRLRCNFAGTTMERASWDRAVELDLTTSRGLAFEMRCRDAAPISHFSLYLASGAGWYHLNFHPDNPGEWETIVLDKAAATVEGQPAGWGHISTIRLSAWRGDNQDTELLVRGLRRHITAGADAQVVVVRADSATELQPSEAKSVDTFATGMAERLAAAGVDAVTVSDRDLTPALLKPFAVAVLPHNPTLPDAAATALRGFIAGGGKLLVCYGIPAALRSVVKLTPGAFHKGEPGQFAAIRPLPDALPGAPAQAAQHSWNIMEAHPEPGVSRTVAEWLDSRGQPSGYPAIVATDSCLWLTHVLINDGGAAKDRLLLAMLGRLAPGLWRRAASAAIASVGRLGHYRTVEQVATAVKGSPAAAASLATARSLLAEATRQRDEQHYPQALETAQRAQESLREAYARAQTAVPGEFRAFWCHSAAGLAGRSWDAAIKRLADNGFTAILPNMLWGGVSFGRSDVLPNAGGEDQIAACLAACRKYGLQIHVWKVDWNLGWQAPKAFVEQLRAAGRLQVSSQGVEEPWLCPSHPANQQLEIDSLVEVARRYPVDGLHFDYIRYPDHDHCFCAGCRQRFAAASGADLAGWPKCVLAGGAQRAAWLDWRRRNIDLVVKGTSEGARAVRPGIKLSAAVFRNWTTDRDGVGQDWKLWCDRGWLDFVCPMDYTTSDSQFANWIVKQRAWAGGVPVYPGIGASATGIRMGAEQVIDQVQVARAKGCTGFVVFNYGTAEADEIVPWLGVGVTGK